MPKTQEQIKADREFLNDGQILRDIAELLAEQQIIDGLDFNDPGEIVDQIIEYLDDDSLRAQRPFLGERQLFDLLIDNLLVQLAMDFESGALPELFTYTRNDANSTYIDNSGYLRKATANTPRFHKHGEFYGLLFEPPRTNKCENYNALPTDNTGFTVISGTATITADAQSTKISDAKLENVLTNGNLIKIENTGGGTAVIGVDGQAGNTNNHSLSAYIAYGDSGYHGTFKVQGSSEQTLLQHGQDGNDEAAAFGDLRRIKLENATVDNASRVMTFNLGAGEVIWVALTQYEEGAKSTTPIVVAGASASRARSVCLGLLADIKGWNEGAGSICCNCVPFDLEGEDSRYIFLATKGTGLEESYGAYINAGTAHMRPRTIAGNTNYQNNDIHKPIADKKFFAAQTWKNGENTAIAGPMSYKTVSLPAQPAGLTNFYLGGRPFNNAFHGLILNTSFLSLTRTVPQIGTFMIGSTDRVGVWAGQSNAANYFRSQIGSLNDGEVGAVEEMDKYWAATRNHALNAALGGSAAMRSNDGSSLGWWWDDAADSFVGGLMEQFEAKVKAVGLDKIEFILWNQGSADNEDKATIKNAWLKIFTEMRRIVGDVPIFIEGRGRRTDSEAHAYYNNQHEANWEIVAENDWAYLLPDTWIFDLEDAVHKTPEGYAQSAELNIRYIMSVLGESVSGPVEGPSLASGTWSGTTVTINITYPAGGENDFTGGNADNFKLYEGGSAVALSNFTKVNANQFTLTAASAPTPGEKEFWYGYGSMYNTTQADYLRGNDATYAMPFKRVKLILT